MLLRSTLERVLPVKDGERRLTGPERKYGALRGAYYFRGDVVGARTQPNPDKKKESDPPYVHTLTRRSISGIRTQSGEWRLRDDPAYEVAQSISEPEVRRRINRVQKAGRLIKTVATLAAAGVGIAAIAEANSAADAAYTAQFSHVLPCADDTLLTGNETLLPLKVSVEQAQRLGEAVCMIGDNPYEFTPANP